MSTRILQFTGSPLLILYTPKRTKFYRLTITHHSKPIILTSARSIDNEKPISI